MCMSYTCITDQGPAHIDSLSIVTPSPGAVVTISGQNFGVFGNSSLVRVNGAIVDVILEWDVTVIVILLPPYVTSGYIQVVIGTTGSNIIPLTIVIQPPSMFLQLIC